MSLERAAIGRMPWPFPNLDLIAKATVYRPRVGRRDRTFKTMAEAQDYEVGFTEYPNLPADASKAMVTGNLDADANQQFTDELRAEKARGEGL